MPGLSLSLSLALGTPIHGGSGPPPTEDTRVTEAGDTRVTMNGDTRVTET